MTEYCHPLHCLKCRKMTQRGENVLEDPIDHYNRCWADDTGVVQKVVCSTCQSEVAVFMRNQQTENKRRGSNENTKKNEMKQLK